MKYSLMKSNLNKSVFFSVVTRDNESVRICGKHFFKGLEILFENYENAKKLAADGDIDIFADHEMHSIEREEVIQFDTFEQLKYEFSEFFI